MNYEEQIAELESQISSLKKRWDVWKSNKKIKCEKCGVHSKIKDIDLIDVQYYDNEAYSEGYRHSEYNYICDECNCRNRLFFPRGYHLEWSIRNKIDIEQEFMFEYFRLFKSVTVGRDMCSKFVNNRYLEKRLKSFLSTQRYNKLRTFIEAPK